MLKTTEQYIGQKFNHWLILEARPHGLKGMVLAQCDCGKKVVTRMRSIKTGVSKSCGCLRYLYAKRGKRIGCGNTALNKCYSHYRSKAERVNQEFSLTIEQFEKLTSSNCYYCEDKPSAIYKTKYDVYHYNGLDRVDNSGGYSIKNVVPCCYQCNTNKGGVTLDMINKILEFINANK